MKKWLAGILLGGGALLMTVGLLLSMALEVAADGTGDPGGRLTSVLTVPGIPAVYVRDLQAAGARFGVPWAVLAGIYEVECDFGRSHLAGCNPPGTENFAGAQGPGQFLAPTWRHGLRSMELIPPGPPTVSTADGFATDGDGNGIADPWDPADATASTARMLAPDGAATDLRGAIYDYDHSPAYVDEVLALAARYEREARRSGSSAAATVIVFARAQLGKPYQWGGAGPDTWDCSGLVMVAYEQVGIDLPHNAREQYERTAAATVPLRQLAPGDLVFFGPDLAGIEHVGIYVGDGYMIDAPHTGAFVRIEPYRWSDLLVATRPLTPSLW